MSVNTTTTLATAGLYVPFRGNRRSGVVGTVHAHLGAVGDATGGTVTILLSMTGDEFGFPLLLVPVFIQAESPNAENGLLTYPVGNERVGGQGAALVEVVPNLIAVARNVGTLRGAQPHISVPLDANQPAVTVLTCQWATNSDGVSYNLRLYAMAYDQQAMAQMQEMDLGGPIAGPL